MVEKLGGGSRGEMKAGILVVVALLIGIAGTSIGLIRAIQAEREIRQKIEDARQISDFLVSLFEVSDPNEERGNTITAKEILDRGAEKIEREQPDQPLRQAQMMQTLGRVYSSLGLYQQAQPLLERALTIMKDSGDESRSEMVDGLLELSFVYGTQRKYTEALLLSREALLIREENLGADHLEVAPALERLGALLRDTGDYAQARIHLERALAIRENALGPEHVGIVRTLTELGRLHNMAGEYEAAVPLYERALLIGEKELGEDHPQVAQSLSELSFLKRRMENPEEVEESRESLESPEPSLPTPEKVVEVASPQAVPAERSPRPIEPVPTDQPASPRIGAVEFTVQIAAFRTRLQAEQLLAVLQNGGYVAHILEPDGTESASYFRVRVGQFATQEEAREAGSNLRRSFPRQVDNFWIIPTEE
jgi:tetratricopeptide (TPR) repeat protein